MRYPFTDVVMYTAPLAVAAVAWLSATVINVSCGSIACKVSLFQIVFENVPYVSNHQKTHFRTQIYNITQKTEDALKKVYLYILFSTLVLAWK